MPEIQPQLSAKIKKTLSSDKIGCIKSAYATSLPLHPAAELEYNSTDKMRLSNTFDPVIFVEYQ